MIKTLFFSPKLLHIPLNVLSFFSPNSRYLAYFIFDEGLYVLDLFTLSSSNISCLTEFQPTLPRFAKDNHTAVAPSRPPYKIFFVDFKNNAIVKEIKLPVGNIYFVSSLYLITNESRLVFVAGPDIFGYIDVPEFFPQPTDIPQDIDSDSFDIVFSSSKLIMNIPEDGSWKLEIFDIIGNRIYR